MYINTRSTCLNLTSILAHRWVKLTDTVFFKKFLNMFLLEEMRENVMKITILRLIKNVCEQIYWYC